MASHKRLKEEPAPLSVRTTCEHAIEYVLKTFTQFGMTILCQFVVVFFKANGFAIMCLIGVKVLCLKQ